MPRTRIMAAQSVAKELSIAESSIDETIQSIATLTATMAAARVDARLAIASGQDALLSVANAMRLVSDARGELVRAHGQLLTVQDDMGLKELSFGNMAGCPNGSSTHQAEILQLRA
jgi:glutamine phosphoribosylpyrophosphate amidotransferase